MDVKQILHINCSPRGHAAESYRLSKKIVDHLLTMEPAARVISRNVTTSAIEHVDENYAISQQSLVDVSSEGSAAVSAILVAELKCADFLVIGTPVHNFTVPSALKAWIDHVVRVRWTFDVTTQGKVGRLYDRPVYIAFSSGGRFSGEGARQPDFLTPYLRAVFGIIGLRDLRFFSVQGTVFGSEVLDQARSNADEALLAHFSTLQLDSSVQGSRVKQGSAGMSNNSARPAVFRP
jgi:FMN-dependent NADH-azoreductase